MKTPPRPVEERQSPARRLVTSFAVAVATCLVLGPLTAAPAHAAGGPLSGTVTEPGGNVAIQDAVVEVFPVDGTTVGSSAVASTETDENGVFSLSGLPPGNVKVRISDVDGNHVAEYYNNARDAGTSTTVSVVDGQSKSLGIIDLEIGAGFTGTVEGEDGLPVEAASVYALAVGGTAVRYETFTDYDGSYTLQGLPAGEYKIQFYANSSLYIDEFYNDRSSVEAADPVSVTAGSPKPLGRTTLAVVVPVGGHVTDSAGAPLGGIRIEAHEVVAGVEGSRSSADATTVSDGSFSLRLRPGTFRIRILDGANVYRNLDGDIVTIEAGESPDSGLFTREPSAVTVPPVHAPPPVAKKSASVKVSAKGGRKKATLTITVKASGVTPTGRVTIKLGSKTLKTVTLKRGKAKVTLKKQKKGKRTYKVVYTGDSKVRAKTVSSKKVKIT